MTVGIIVAIIVAILIIAAVVAVMARRGSGRGAAEAELSRLPLRSLSASEHTYYLDDWVHVQGSFVDAPGTALDSADTLVRQLLQNVGYPTDDEQRLVRLLSVRHGANVQAYREAHAVHEKRKAGATDLDTETLRVALNGYDALFQDLIGAHAAAPDQTAAGQAQLDDTRVDDAPADRALAAGTAADQAPVDDTRVDDTRVDGTRVDDAPADRALTRETPTGETTATGETPADETPTDDSSTRRHEAEAAS